jgi:hypothetical protein
MAKLTLNDITTGYGSETRYNANNDLIEAALENTLSRDGTSPNTMGASLDMNSNRILNLPSPVGNAEAATKAYVDASTTGIDLSTLQTMLGSQLEHDDKYLVEDDGEFKGILHREAGIPIVAEATTLRTLTSNDMNTTIRCTSGSATSVVLNTGVGVVGAFLLIVQSGAGQVTVSGTATINGAKGLKTRTQHSVIGLLCLAANTWVVYGDAIA